jgi:A/G-specific adenine glycosylase
LRDPNEKRNGMDDAGLRKSLLEFYDERKRDLPWRRSSDPYGVWVSEIMLQQTRVETVIPYYLRWMERFPTLVALAEADEDAVLSTWSGLGYYSRARNLRRAARVVRERFGGVLPESVEELRELPGVGEYTAGAVASIAFGRPEPAVDGNVRRVLARLLDEPDPGAALLRRRAAELVDPERPGDFNQALMELGATVCTRHNPQCGACPWRDGCGARRAGTVEERPTPRRRGRVAERAFETAVVRVESRGASTISPRFLVRRRPGDGLLGGMWEFPEFKALDALPWPDSGPGRPHPSDGTPLSEVEHVFSHLRATYRPTLLPLDSPFDLPSGWLWADRDELAELALPRAQERILALALLA